tara:strand:- start:370 stop:645 length:276 start_codon:yes stop_codon:yes gene_type:complete
MDIYAIKYNENNDVVTICDQPLGGGTQLEILGDTAKLFDQDLKPTRFASYKIIDSDLSKEELKKKYSKPIKVKELKWGKQIDGVLYEVEKA